MKKLTLLLLLFTAGTSFCQDNATKNFNLDFETKTTTETLPDGWFTWGKGYAIVADNTIAQKGNTAISLTPAPDNESKAFGCVVTKIPAVYSGSEIELKGFLKLEDVDKGFAGLIMRIDGKEGVLQFDNMNSTKLHGTIGWKQYSITLTYPEGATGIYVGALNSGTGKVWVDNLEVLIDGKDIQTLMPIPQQTFKADQDKEFDAGSKITDVQLSTSKAEDLQLLGMIWGYLKYYHPAVATGNYNWDYELFRLVPKITESTTHQQRDAVLLNWITTLGTFEISPAKAPKNIKMQADLEWIDKFNLSQALKQELYKIKDAKRSDKSYYMDFEPGVGSPIFKNESGYKAMLYPDAGFRLLTLYRYWNMIHYFFPYKNLIEEDWNVVLKEFVPKFINAKNETEYQLTTLEIIARIHDSHANLTTSNKNLNKYWGGNNPAIEITFIEEQAVVTGYHDEELGKKTGMQIGDVITNIDSKPVTEFIKTNLKQLPASNYPTQLRNYSSRLLSTNKNSLKIEYTRDKEKLSTTLDTYGPDKINIYKRYAEKEKDTCFKMINPKIAYIYPGSLKNNYLPAIMKQVQNTDGLIIDLRCYPADFIVFTLGEYLLPKSTPFVRFTATSNATPGLFATTETIKVGQNKKDFYKGNTMILVNETTQSNAEYTTMALQIAPNTKVMGSTTAGADGNVSIINLPGGLSSYISGIGVYYPDGKETQRIGIVPDIEAKPTIKGIREKRDEVLEKAIKLLSEK